MVGNEADVKLCLNGLHLYVVAADLDVARGDGLNSNHRLDNRGLTRAVRTEEAENLTRMHLEGHVLNRIVLIAAVSLAEVLYCKSRRIISAYSFINTLAAKVFLEFFFHTFIISFSKSSILCSIPRREEERKNEPDGNRKSDIYNEEQRLV